MRLDVHSQQKGATVFEMSKEAKKLWLAARKKATNFGAIQVSGLFDAQIASPLDVFFFWVAVICELAGFGILVWLGLTNLVGFIVVLMFIAFDVVFAWLAHKLEASKCEFERFRLLSRDPIATNQIKTKLFSSLRKFLTGFGILGIVSIAAGKAFGFWYFYGTFDIVSAFVILIYVLIAYAHINHTWFVITAWRLDLKVKSDYADFQKSYNPTTKESSKNFIGDVRALDIFCEREEIRVCKVADRHEIVLLEKTEHDKKPVFKYSLITRGVLTDEELHSLINVQNTDEGMQKIAVAGMQLQYYRILPTDAVNKIANKQQPSTNTSSSPTQNT